MVFEDEFWEWVQEDFNRECRELAESLEKKEKEFSSFNSSNLEELRLFKGVTHRTDERVVNSPECSLVKKGDVECKA